MIIVA